MAISGIGSASGSRITSGASPAMSPARKMTNLFQQIDASGSGVITQSQFKQAFAQMNPPTSFKALGADAIFSQLNPQGGGGVSQQDFVSGMTNLMQSLRGQSSAIAANSSPAQTLASSRQSLEQLGTSSTATTGSGLGTTVDSIV